MWRKASCLVGGPTVGESMHGVQDVAGDVLFGLVPKLGRDWFGDGLGGYWR